MDHGTIEIVRRKAVWVDRLRAYQVVIDGVRRGTIENGARGSWPVEPGRHTLRLGLDWGRSEPLGLDVASGQTVRVECFARHPLAVLYFVSLGFRRYIGVRRVSDANPARQSS